MSLGTTVQLLPCEHQVGGHLQKDGKPGSLIDNQGRFYKPLQTDTRAERAEREVQFYTNIEALRKSLVAPDAVQATDVDLAVQKLLKYIPKCYGTTQSNGQMLLVLDDVCAQYAQPCVLDLKIGMRTWSPHADPDQIAIYKQKDEATTQATLGYRVCGMQCYNATAQSMWKADRQWGKTLTADNITTAFLKFSHNGVLSPVDVFKGPQGVMRQLQDIEQFFNAQRQWHFYSCSLLLAYDGIARTAETANVQVRLIDFAHVFPANGEVDSNFLGGLHGVMSTIRKVCEGRVSAGGAPTDGISAAAPAAAAVPADV